MRRMDAKVVSVAALGWAIGAMATPAAAQSAGDQQAPAATPAADDQQASADKRDKGLGEIVVTAEKREENLQKVPAAATALTGGDLDKKAVERVADLQYAAPSLSITDAGLTQSVNIRGIGLASGSPAVSNGVATYYDNIFQPPILTTGLFYDVGTVEVLRGPQGTFVGSNSTGGAIFINTANPSLNGVSGYAKASYGNYDAFGGEGAVNVPVSSVLAVRAAGIFQRRDSYFTDIGPYHNHPDRLNEKAGRFAVLFQPSNFRAIAKVEWIDRNTGGFAYRPIEGTTFAYDRQDDDIRTLTYNAPTKVHERGFQADLEMRYETDGGVVLRSVSGYVNKRMNNLYDLDGAMTQLPRSPDPLAPPPPSATQTQDQFVREREWVQEVNIISPTDGAFNWILGGYFQKNKIDVDIQQTSSNPIAFNPADPTDIVIGQNKTTTGLFAQLGYKIVPQLELQVGARYSHFKDGSAGNVTIGNGSPFFPPGGLQVADLGGKHSDGRFTGKIGLNWTPDDNNLVYVFAARGYKPGGSNGGTSEFRPETVWDYEAGWKSSFLDNHVRTQVGAFYMSYKDFQIDSVEPTTGQGGVHNVSNATIKGVELQVQAKLGGFGFDGGLAYVDSKLDKFQFINQRLLPGTNLGPQCKAGVTPPACFDYGPFTTIAGGGPNLYSPKWSYNFGVQYQAQIAPDMTLTPRLNYAYIGARWTNLLLNPVTDYLPGRGLLSALLTLQKGEWTIEGYGSNLTNKKYISGQFINDEFYGAPREYGVRASVRF